MGGETTVEVCNVCGDSAFYSCGRCKSVHYCSRDHQRIDYSEHGLNCNIYKVQNSDTLGQHIVASCLIAPGNTILKENPILIGPMANSNLVCLTCFAPITDKDFYKCPECHWPMCSKDCADAKAHILECDILSDDTTEVGVPKTLGETPRYDLILILRGLLLKKTNPKAWDCLKNMESHFEIRKLDNDPFQKAAVRYFTEICKGDFNEDDIHQVRGAILTNCIIFRGESNIPLRGLFQIFRLFNHSCVPNVHVTASPNGEIQAKAAVKVQKNEPLCICYTGTMEPLWKRQQYLNEIYKFQCCCRRCCDPTELGTHFSSPRCPDCRRSFMLPPGDGTISKWTCENCNLKYEFVDVMQEVSEWLYRLDMNDVVNSKSPLQLSKELDKTYDSFNHLHFVPLQFTQCLLKVLKNGGYHCHKLRQEIWENHLEIISILEPGMTRRRGVTLCQHALSTLAMVKAGVLENEIYLPRIPDLLRETYLRLNEAQSIMQLEPKDSLERSWMYTIQKAVSDVQQYRTDFDTTGTIATGD